MVESKTLLVTGGSGYIGSHTVVELLSGGLYGFTKIVIVDNLENSSSKVLQRIAQITGAELGNQFCFEQVDLRDKEALDAVFTKYQPVHSVIHFAGLKAVGVSVSQPLYYYENNVCGTVALLQVMDKHGCNNIIFSSSATVYGNNPLAKEGDAICATNPYGQSKVMIEQSLKDYAHANRNFSAICLRYFNPIGAHSSGLIGEDPTGVPNNLMPYIQRIASGHLPHLTVYGTDYDTKDGTGVRDYIHVTDLARGHIAALNK